MTRPPARSIARRLATAKERASSKGIRFLLTGGFNTAFAYGVSTGLYYALNRRLHIVAIGAIANVICITEAFVAYKLFVFRTSGGWLREYLRCYVVYGGNAVVGIAGLWLLVNVIGVPFWIAQGVLMVAGIVISYVGHDRFTFNKAQRG